VPKIFSTFFTFKRSCWAFAGGAAIDGAFKIQKSVITAQSQEELGNAILLNNYKS
jgi:hypothetical protein